MILYRELVPWTGRKYSLLALNRVVNCLVTRYRCCLFLARLRSATLVKLDEDTCVAIDKLIDRFLQQRTLSEISKWKRDSYWMTMVPLFHLAFAAGKEYYCNETRGLECDLSQSEIVGFAKSRQSGAATTEVDEADKDDTKGLQSGLCLFLNSNRREENHERASERIKRHILHAVSGNTKIEASVSEDKNILTENRKNQFTWPGSPSTQRLGIFSLMHVFALKENQQLALAENLLPYLVCPLWHLKDDERELLTISPANFHNASSPPSLKVIVKSFLALVNGLDMVYAV